MTSTKPKLRKSSTPRHTSLNQASWISLWHCCSLKCSRRAKGCSTWTCQALIYPPRSSSISVTGSVNRGASALSTSPTTQASKKPAWQGPFSICSNAKKGTKNKSRSMSTSKLILHWTQTCSIGYSSNSWTKRLPKAKILFSRPTRSDFDR